jgi:cell division protein FtsW
MPASHLVSLPQTRLDPPEARGVDLWVLFAAIALVGLGIVMVFSASIPMAAVDQSEDIYYYLKRECLFAAIGLCALAAATRIPMDLIRRHAGTMLLVANLLLIITLIWGIRVNGAKSWLPVPGTGFRFQTSELAKLVVIIATARYFARFRHGIPNWRRALPPLAMLGMSTALIAVQPDLGTAAVLVVAAFAHFHIAGMRFRHVLVAAGSGAALAAAMISQHPYQFERLSAFFFRAELASEGGYHTTHSLIAMGSGGLLGRGIAGSVEKYFYLPAAINDSILAVIGEEIGLLGTWAVLAAIGLLLWRGITIASQASDRFAGLVASGVTCLIVVQAVVNVAVATGVAPCTGVPLPFVSYGGSSLVFSLAGVGLLLNVSRMGAAPAPGAEKA